jgi:hypothetical protein
MKNQKKLRELSKMEGEIIGREKLRMKDVTIKPPKKTIEQVI